MDFHSLEKQTKEYLSHGQSREAMNFLERELVERKEVPDTEDYKKAMIELCDIYNDLASELLASGDTKEALVLLRKAEGVNVNLACKVKTLNTLACYYRQIGKARIAESYLLKALNLRSDIPNTHLNLCAVLSELGKHEEAVMQAMQAVILMQDLLILLKKNPETQVDESLMPIAFLNLGVELEFLKRFEEALGFYKRAQSFAEKKLTPDHPVKKNAESAVKELTKKLGLEKKEPKVQTNKIKKSNIKENNKNRLVTKWDGGKNKPEKKNENSGKEEKRNENSKEEKKVVNKNKEPKIESPEKKTEKKLSIGKKKSDKLEDSKESQEKKVILESIEEPIIPVPSNLEAERAEVPEDTKKIQVEENLETDKKVSTSDPPSETNPALAENKENPKD